MYRTTDCSFYTDPKIRRLSSYAVAYVFQYLFNNDHSHMSGIYFITPDTIAHETRVPQDIVDSALKELSDCGMIFIDTDRDIIFVKSMFRRQCINKSQKRVSDLHVSSIVRQLKTLNDSPLIGEYLRTYGDINIPLTYPLQGVCSPSETPGDTPTCTASASASASATPPLPPAGGRVSRREEVSRIVGLTDRDSQMLEIQSMLPSLQETYPLLDMPVEFEEWRSWILENGKIFVDYTENFIKLVKRHSREAEKKARDNPISSQVDQVEDRFSDEVFFRPMKAPY
jgi:hypothetical protein